MTSSAPKPTQVQLEMLRLLREYHWKVWVPDFELANARLAKPGLATSAQAHAARRHCFRLRVMGLTEYVQDGLGGYSFRLTRAAREVLR